MSPSRKIKGVKCFNSSYIITKWLIILNNVKLINWRLIFYNYILAQMRLQLFSHTVPVLTVFKTAAVQERLWHVVISENYKDDIAAVKMAAASVPQTRTRISQSHKKAGRLQTHTHSSATYNSLHFPQTSSISLLCHLFIFLPPLPLSRSHSFPD